MQSIFADHNEQIKGVLNDEQKQQFEQMMQRRGRMREGGHASGRRPDASTGRQPIASTQPATLS